MTNNEVTEQFLSLLESNTGIIIKIARSFTVISQDREDLTNDIVLELWKSYKSFNQQSKISTWLYRVAINTALNFNRKSRRGRISLLPDIKDEALPWLIVSQDDDEKEILYECINELNPLNKAIILLYLDGNSHDDIAEIMGMSKTNVGTKISRIKEQIKNIATKKH